MATENLNQTLPQTPVTLCAEEYLRFLQMIETGLPDGTRAYLVHIGDDGERRMKPAPTTSSVIDLQKDIIKHLDAGPSSDELLQQLHKYCADRLQHRGISTTPHKVNQAGIIFEQCAALAASIDKLSVDAIAKEGDESIENELRCINQLISQPGYQVDLGASMIGSGPCFGDVEDWMMLPAYHWKAEDQGQPA